jgi:hypothetical protein
MALPAGAAAGDPAFAFGQNAASTSITMTATGWTQLIGAAANNMYVVGCWKVLDSTDIATGSISFTVTSRSHPFQLVVFDGTQVSGIDASASLPLSSSAYGTRGGVTQATTPAPSVTPSGSSKGILFAFERSTATGTTISSMSITATTEYFAEFNTTAATTLLVASFTAPGGTATGIDTVTYSGTSGNGLAFILPLTAVGSSTQTISPSGLGSAEAFGTAVISGGQVNLQPTGIASAEAFGTATVIATPVQRWKALPQPIYASHRGGSLNWPEETLYAYAQSCAWNPELALEVSVWPSSDGVWVCSHDQNTSRVFGTSMDIPTSTWASLSGLTSTSGGQPIARLDDVIAAYATGNRVLIVEDKPTTNFSGFLDFLDARGGPARFIIKAQGTATTQPSAARTRGYETWGYWFPADAAPNSTTVANFTILALEYDDTSTRWSNALAFGKPVHGHIIDTTTHASAALGLGATGLMVSNVTGVVPQGTSQLLVPSPITSSEAFGSDTITTGPVSVAPTAIGSAEAFGADTISPGPVTVTPVAIASAGVFGAGGVSTGPVSVLPAGIGSAEAFGVDVISTGPVSVLPVAIGSLEAFGVDIISTGPVSILPVAIASAEGFGTASFAVGPVNLLPVAIGSAEAFGVAIITPGPTSVLPVAIGSAEIFGAPVVSAGGILLSPVGIASAQAFGSLTVQPGAVTLLPVGIGSLEAIGALGITPGSVSLLPLGIGTTESIGNPIITSTGAIVAPSGIITREGFGIPSLLTGSVHLFVVAIPTQEAFGNLHLTIGAGEEITLVEFTLAAQGDPFDFNSSAGRWLFVLEEQHD